jgi:hypothetical protein
VVAGAQTLVDRIVLAIHGKEFDIGLTGRAHHDFARRDENLFVGKSDLLSRFHGGVRRFEAYDADGRGNQGRGGWVSCDGDHAGGTVLNLRQFREARSAEAFRETGGDGRGGKRNQFWVMAKNLLRQLCDIVSRRQRYHSKPFGHCFDNGKGLAADGSGGTENGDLLQIKVLQFLAGFRS